MGAGTDVHTAITHLSLPLFDWLNQAAERLERPFLEERRVFLAESQRGWRHRVCAYPPPPFGLVMARWSMRIDSPTAPRP